MSSFILFTETLQAFFRGDIAHAVMSFGMQALLLGIFFWSDLLARKYPARTRGMLGPSRRMLPLLIASASVIGIGGLVLETAAWQTDAVGILLTPFVIPMLVMYFLWGMASMAVGTAAYWLGLPLLTGFWIVTAITIMLGIVIPLVLTVRRKHLVLPRVVLAFMLPLFVIVPVMSHDIPDVTFHVPLIWSWEEMERKQLNVTYPWSGALMHLNDGVNTGYAANVIDGVITVMQDKSVLVRVTHDTVAMERNSIHVDWTATGWYGPELPDAFACNGVDLRSVSDTHSNTTSPLGMFGMGCDELTYRGNLIANIRHGTLIDLDLADDGLLAVSINMGSYDPTYVYVVDIAQYMK